MESNHREVEIRTLTYLHAKDFNRIASGYESGYDYRPVWNENEEGICFSLKKLPLAQTFVKVYDPLDSPTIRRYRRALKDNFSFGAFMGNRLVGLLIAEKSLWNLSLWVWEFHVEKKYRGQGIGRKLMLAAVEKARAAGLRIIVCETQNKNAFAIQAYQRLGFKVEGIDLSYYTNQDYPDGEIAVFMKYRLDGNQQALINR
jgi:ribosomal protein S18 acetylase RimI-like enzyme